MDQPYLSQEGHSVINGWLFQETVDLEREKEELEKDRQELKKERRRLEDLERNLTMREGLEKQRREREEQLFHTKWKMLETELTNLAEEKRKFALLQASYNRTKNDSGEGVSILFRGVHNELTLKKRYKDLMKIYHPDNLAGDHEAVVEIRKEFEKMQEQLHAVD